MDMVDRQSRPRTTGTEDLVFVGCTVWIMVGLCLDGWAHQYQPELETFFTPWHAVFYAGFTAAAGWLAVLVMRRRADSPSLVAAIPSGYELSVVGLGLFAVGGVGDGIWHTVFGIETSIDALLSPTHLLMLVGLTMSGSAPVRAAWRDRAVTTDADKSNDDRAVDRPEAGARLRDFLAPAGATAVLATSFAFFFLYANGFSNWPMQDAFRPGGNEVPAALGVLSTLASTVILLGAVLVLLRRWDPPFGTFTLIFTAVGVFMAGLDAFDFWWQIIAPVVGGLTADLIMRTNVARSVRWRAGMIGLAVPLTMWSVSTLAHHLTWGVGWPPELWVGQIVLAMMAGYGLSLLAFPPPTVGTSRTVEVSPE